MEKQIVSIIVPIYNVERYLRRCIDSILNQSYKNIEILLINDGSPDNSHLICDEYAHKDSRVRVIHQNNKGLAETRNIGIKESKGTYLVFIDSDDYIDPNMIEILLQNLIKTNSDISSCGHFQVYSTHTEQNSNGKFLLELTPQEALSKFLFTHIVDVVSWNKLYKRSVFEGIHFPTGKLYEDHYTIYKLIDNSEKIVYDSQPLYYYCKRDSSIGGCKFTPRIFELEEALTLECTYISEKYPEISKQISLGEIIWLMVIYNKMLLSDYDERAYRKKIKSKLKKHIHSLILNKDIYLKNKCQLLIFFISSSLYKVLYKYYIQKNRIGNE